MPTPATQARPAPGARPAPSSPAAQSSASSGMTLDPLKLIRQYFWWLVAAVVLGVAVGVGGNMALLKLAPQFRGEVVFEFLAQITEADEPATTTGGTGESEIERFIGSQLYVMTSDSLLQEAANDPAIRNDTQWANQFRNEQGDYNPTDAFLELKSIIDAHSVPESNIVLLRATAGNANDAATIANAVRDVYLRNLEQKTTQESQDVLETLTQMLTATQEERRLLEDRMQQLLEENQITTLNEERTSQAQEINALIPYLQEIRRALEDARDRVNHYEQQLAAPGGATYPEEVRSQVKQHPIVQRFEVQIADLQAMLRRLKERFGPEHRQVESLKRAIDSAKAQKRQEEQRLLEEMFVQLIEMTKMQIRSLETQEAETLASLEAAQRKLADVKTVLEQYGNMEADAERLAEQEADLEQRIAEQRAIVERAASKRVQVQASATPPDEPYFPTLLIMVPASVVLLGGLTGGVITLRELLEQRVRGPADVGLIPRARVLGVIPETSEDPTRPRTAESAVLERPTGIVAESIRQIRTNLLKQLTQRGHKALLVVGGMPRSGASATIVNLAHCLASAEHRVLVIDANFRRPSMHKYLEAAEDPGLAEVLTGSCQLAEAVQQTHTPGLEVLTAGAPGGRIYERLSTQAMSRTLDQARAEYDLVLVDAPPAIVSGDAVALATRCDAAVLVVRAFGEKRGLVARIRDQLEDTRAEFMGVIVNAVRSAAGGYFKRNFRTAYEYQNGLPESKNKGEGRLANGRPSSQHDQT